MSERYIAVETEYINDWIVVDLRYRWKKDVTASAKIVTPVMREHDAKLLAAAKNVQEQG